MTKPLAIGVDVGKQAIHVCPHPARSIQQAMTISNEETARFNVRVIEMTDPAWWTHLLELIPDRTPVTVCAESTGHHLLAPIAALLHAYRPYAALWVVPGMDTAAARSKFSTAKTDEMDARALCILAMETYRGSRPKNVRPFNAAAGMDIYRLRAAVNAAYRAEKETTRYKNRLHALVHNLCPALGFSLDTYIAIALAGFITPHQIKAVLDGGSMKLHYKAEAVLKKAVSCLPDITPDPFVISGIQEALLAHVAAKRERDAAMKLMIERLAALPEAARVARIWAANLPGANSAEMAAILIACNGDPAALRQRDFVASIGVNAVSASSGKRDKTGRVIRKGYRYARRAAHLWALRLLSPSLAANVVRDYYQERGGKGGCSIYKARTRLVRRLWALAVYAPDPADQPIEVSPANAGKAKKPRKTTGQKAGKG